MKLAFITCETTDITQKEYQNLFQSYRAHNST